MDTALPQKFPFILDRILAKANCTGNQVCTSCDTVVLGRQSYQPVRSSGKSAMPAVVKAARVVPPWHREHSYREAWLCLPPSVTGEVYCFPRRQLIFSFGRRVIYHLKGLWEYNPKSIPSVCTTTIFKRIAGLCFHLKSFINGFVSTSSTN